MTRTLDLHPEDLAGWIRNARAGDREAMDRILTAHEQPVLRVALRMLGQLEDAQDATQEVFLRLYRSIDQFQETQAFRPWLYRMTVNICLDMLRRRKPLVELEDTPAPQAQADAGLIEQERRTAMEWALQRLPPRERAAVLLREVEGLSTREVAEALQVEEATVRSHIYQARTHLRELVQQYERRPR